MRGSQLMERMLQRSFGREHNEVWKLLGSFRAEGGVLAVAPPWNLPIRKPNRILLMRTFVELPKQAGLSAWLDAAAASSSIFGDGGKCARNWKEDGLAIRRISPVQNCSQTGSRFF